MCMHKDAYAISSQSKVSENRVPSFNVLQSSTPSVEQFDFSIFPILVLSSFFLLQVHLPFCTMDTRPPVVMGVSSFWSKSEGRVKGKEFFFFSSSFFFSIPFIRLIQVFGRNDLFQSIQSVPILFFSTCNHAVENPLSRTLDPDGRMDGGWNAISGDPFPFQV